MDESRKEYQNISITVRADANSVTGILDLRNGTSVSLTFGSPDQLLAFIYAFIEKASQVWPEKQWIGFLKSNENENG